MRRGPRRIADGSFALKAGANRRASGGFKEAALVSGGAVRVRRACAAAPPGAAPILSAAGRPAAARSVAARQGAGFLRALADRRIVPAHRGCCAQDIEGTSATAANGEPEEHQRKLLAVVHRASSIKSSRHAIRPGRSNHLAGRIGRARWARRRAGARRHADAGRPGVFFRHRQQRPIRKRYLVGLQVVALPPVWARIATDDACGGAVLSFSGSREPPPRASSREINISRGHVWSRWRSFP